MSESKWEAVQSKVPSKRELSTWTEGQYINFLRFCEFFIITDEDTGKMRLSVSKSKWRDVEGFLDMPNHPFHEFLYRINYFTLNKNASEKKFLQKLMAMMRSVLGYLRLNPSLVSVKLREIIEPNERFKWCLTQTKVVETGIDGVSIVKPDNEMSVSFNSIPQSIPAYEKQLTDSILKVTNLLNNVMDSITVDDIKKLPTKEKMLIIGRMSWVFNIGKNFRPNKSIFKQININSASRETLEAAMLNFNKTDDE